jgi:outer membrane protein assembly factor BamA
MAPARKADPGRYIGRRYALLDYFSSGGFGGFFLCPVSCQQQQVSASNEVSCDGQTVAAVDLIASPKISIESLQPLVQQKTGEPYSSAKVDSGVSALRETGRFTKVAVEVKPDSGGLHVTFILEPVLYFGVFDFPGATKGFSYTRLLQVIDIPNQTPYKQDAVTKAEENLRSFLVAAGYFQAQVQPEPQFDETHMLANVVFHVNLGKRAKLGNVEVRGPEPAEANRLLHATRSLRATAMARRIVMASV